MSTALLTDHYELTMLEAALRDGHAERTCVFQVFCRRLPPGRRFAIAAGLGRLLPMVTELEFDNDALAFLWSKGIVSADTTDWLRRFSFSGDIWAYPEGELLLPGSPVLQVVSTFAEATLLETLVLSVLNHDTAIASAAARMRLAAGDRSLLEFGSRRTHEQAAVAAARAAWLAGFDATSNLAAGARWDVPTMGTAAHAWTLLHDDEVEAFVAQVASDGVATTLLVDTYDTERGIVRAVDAAGTELGGVRIDSGDLDTWAERARSILDARGATQTRIIVSGDLDEHRIAALTEAPVDGFGVGTQLVTGSGAPTANLVYKLVARSDHPREAPDVPVGKSSGAKSTIPGRMRATRRYDDDGVATAEVLTPWHATPPEGRPLQVEVVKGGVLLIQDDPADIRDRVRRSLASLPADGRRLDDGPVAVPTEHHADAVAAEGAPR